MNHAFAILSALELKDGNNKIDHQLIMIRNPRNINDYFRKWNNKDNISWKPEYIKQVPFGYDPLTTIEMGVFFLEMNMFKKCFY